MLKNNWDNGGIPTEYQQRITVCMEMDLKHYQGGAFLPWSPLKSVLRICETQITL